MLLRTFECHDGWIVKKSPTFDAEVVHDESTIVAEKVSNP
jgi:hypothetical protein